MKLSTSVLNGDPGCKELTNTCWLIAACAIMAKTMKLSSVDVFLRHNKAIIFLRCSVLGAVRCYTFSLTFSGRRCSRLSRRSFCVGRLCCLNLITLRPWYWWQYWLQAAKASWLLQLIFYLFIYRNVNIKTLNTHNTQCHYVCALSAHTCLASFRFLLEFIRFFRPTCAFRTRFLWKSKETIDFDCSVSSTFLVWALYYCRQTSERRCEQKMAARGARIKQFGVLTVTLTVQWTLSSSGSFVSSACTHSCVVMDNRKEKKKKEKVG